MPSCYTPLAVLFLLLFASLFIAFTWTQVGLSEGLQWVSTASKRRGQANKYIPYLGTKATYDDRLRFDEESWGETVHPTAACGSHSGETRCSNVTFVYHLVRHGTRFPTKGSLKRMKEIEDPLVQRKVSELFTDHSHLTDEGEEELYRLGARMRERYPGIFNEDYHPERYDFSSSHVPRALQSADAYVYGLFEGRGTLGSSRGKAVAIRSEDDALLRFHKKCSLYKSSVKKNEEFLKSGELAKVLEKHVPALAESLVQHAPMNLTFLKPLLALAQTEGVHTLSRRVSSLWDICKFEIALHGSTETCELLGLTASHMHVLQYLEDAELFWLKSYGFSINYDMTCALAKDILRSAEAPEGRNAAARFAHAETLIPLVTKLRVFEDEDIKSIFSTAADIHSLKVKRRMWQGGRVSPFAGNVLFELHSCEGETYVRVMLNEQPVRIGRERKLEVTLAELAQILEAPQCNLEQICSVKDT